MQNGILLTKKLFINVSTVKLIVKLLIKGHIHKNGTGKGLFRRISAAAKPNAEERQRRIFEKNPIQRLDN